MKAILIVDIPDNYQEFGSGIWYIEGDCLRIGYKDKYGWFDGWKWVGNGMMALKPLPQKKDAFEECMKFDMMTGKVAEEIVWQVNGYNYCLEEILGEHDD